MRLAAITKDSITEGPGLRIVVWTQGCNKHCPGCHNPETWDYCGGYEESVDFIIANCNNYPGDVTFCGGEPFDQLTELIYCCKSINKNIWCYTGYTLDQILNSDMKEALQYIDVLIEGPFIESKRSMECKYRGSLNQRLVDAKQTYINNEYVEYTEH